MDLISKLTGDIKIEEIIEDLDKKIDELLLDYGNKMNGNFELLKDLLKYMMSSDIVTRMFDYMIKRIEEHEAKI